MGVLEDRLISTPLGGYLCPLGYAAGIDRLVEDLLQAYSEAVLLDIRLCARSRWYSQWNKSRLQVKWGERYVHEKRLGNVNYRYSQLPVSLLDPEAVFPSLLGFLQQGGVVLLLCACKDYERCHRKVVVESILQRCSDVFRGTGMCFDLVRNVYVGVSPDGVLRVVVDPCVFEQYRERELPEALLYDEWTWREIARQSPELAMIETVL